MSLTRYNPKYELPPAGFHNLGFTCYYNALLQSLLSCTSFTQELLGNAEYNDDQLPKILVYLIRALRSADPSPDIARLAPITWKVMIRKLAEKSHEFAQFAVGQQCAAEGYSLLLQALEDHQGIQNLFFHRRRNKLFCPDCQTWFSEVNELNNVFEVEPTPRSYSVEDLKANINSDAASVANLNEFLLNQVGSVDRDCICSKCNIKSNKIRQSSLVMIPEILFVMSKKYKYEGVGQKMDVYTDFPARLEFPAKGKTKLVYEAVAQIEHSGGLNGGHYWAICRRRDGWYCLNDTHVSPASFRPTNDTYIVLYHIL
jgi:ubiquitin C-terminal hydrolase